jgi:hypothetical protein
VKKNKNRFVIFLSTFLMLMFFACKKHGKNNIDEAYKTEYLETSNPDTKKIKTAFFIVETPKNWHHVFNGHGNEGGLVGQFKTDNGTINYEYGLFAPSYHAEASLNEYIVEKKQINNLLVYLTKSKKNEMNIFIPKQQNMSYPFSLYLSKSVFKNYDELIKVLGNVEWRVR